MKKILLPFIVYLIGTAFLGCSDKSKWFTGKDTNEFMFYKGKNPVFYATELTPSDTSKSSKIFLCPYGEISIGLDLATNFYYETTLKSNAFKKILKEDLSELLEKVDSVRTFKERSFYGLNGEGSTISLLEFVNWAKTNNNVNILK